jgi:RHH-type proline utilization regulon transcriptional repressor/proline dehydrogenase/delta 1-pyrroline-5-carboxylate dehydrogenase
MAAPDIEFQMLYGMAEDLRNVVAEEGYRTRVYLPVGRVIPGMAYLVRRLLENTSNQAWFNVGVASPAAAQAPRTGPRHTSDASHVTPDTFTNAPPAQFFLPPVRERMRQALDRARDGFGRAYPLLVGGRRLDDRELADIRYPADPSTLSAG